MAAHRIPGDIYGVDLKSTDGKVTAPGVTRKDEGLDDWFFSTPDDPAVAIRVFCIRLNPDFQCSPTAIASLLKTPLLDKVVEHAIWGSDIYRKLVENPGGGAVQLTDEPWRFILRTPDDGGRFCSFAASNRRRVVKAIYLFNSDHFDPIRTAGCEQSLSAWKSSGLQVITLAHMYTHAQSAFLTSPDLASVIASVSAAERRLESNTSLPQEHAELGRTLHNCNRSLVDIERRSRFEDQTLTAIEQLVVYSHFGKAPWPAIQPQRMACSARKFDFETLPRRIENARATISALIQQRNEQINLELAYSSERIAEATFADSKSMKTIAILTMVFLPGTAVASLFSMSMFDWSSSDGGNIASKWIWIYFVVTVPLTGIVLAVWWIWGQRVEAHTRRVYAARELQRQQRYVDAEPGPAVGNDETDEIELQTARPHPKVNDGSEV